MGFNYIREAELLIGDSLLLTNKFLDAPGIHLINVERVTGWVDYGDA